MTKFANNPKIDRESLRALPTDKPQTLHPVVNNSSTIGNLNNIQIRPEPQPVRFANNPKIDRDSLRLLPTLASEKEAPDQPTPGYIYIDSNDVFPGVFKVGRSRNPQKRCDTFNTSDPNRGHTIEFGMLVEDDCLVERLVHWKLASYRVSPNVDGEWFKCPIDQIISVIQEVVKSL